MTGVLSIDCVRFQRRRHTVLDGITLDLYKGDFVALLGANGSGKTTLLRLIMGFLKPQSGKISYFRETISGYRQIRKHIGYVPQALPIDYKMPLSVRDIVSMGRFGLAGTGRRLTKEDWRIVDSALDNVGITTLKNRPIGHLSGGEYQKVQLARAISQTPDLLLLDEPTSNLDLGAQRECLDLIVRLHEQYDLTTIIVMHDLKSLPARCNRAVIIDDARLVFDGSFTEVFNESNLAHIYKLQAPRLLRELMAELPVRGAGR